MNPYLAGVTVLITLPYLVNLMADIFNLKRLNSPLPPAFHPHLSKKKYRRTQAYTRTNTLFHQLEKSVTLGLLLLFLVFGGFDWLDQLVRATTDLFYLRALLFAGGFYLLSYNISLPFDLYQTFSIEARFGFNRTSPQTYCFDQVKSLLLALALGAPIYLLLVWIFSQNFPLLWLVAWMLATLIQLFLIFIFPAVILPLFNKFTPLPDNPLKQAILSYARSQNFQLQGIFTMDGSKRSTKSNAFFTGFGRNKRIVLFDTLIQRHSIPELVAVLAHEIGHYKHKHLHWFFALSSLANLILFYLIFTLLRHPFLYLAFQVDQPSVYSGLILVLTLFGPLQFLFSLGLLWLSRRHEYQADAYAVNTYGHPKTFSAALIKLSLHNLSNLTPHPLKVAVSYSHPPVTLRLKHLQATPLS